MKSNLLIFGAGGHGRVVADGAEALGLWERIAFLDDRWPELQESGSWEVLGTFAHGEKFSRDDWGVLPGIGDNALRLRLLKALLGEGFFLETLVYPSSWVSPGASLGGGSVVFAQGAVNTGASLGMGAIVNTGATVDHDCVLGEGVHLSPGAHLAGEVTLGNQVWIGTGAVVLPGVTLGTGVVVGAGAVVLEDVPPHACVMGVPARERLPRHR